MKCRTVILAAGDFPFVGSVARTVLDAAKRVVCCDSAADEYRREAGREPDFVVGDCDSVTGRFARTVHYAEQDTNDLEKALRFCAERGWRDIAILGATGKREDHALGNLFIGMEHGVEMVTDHGRFVPVVGERRFRVDRGAAVSVFANPGTEMSSTGLEWPLDGVRFVNFHRATLNRANRRTVVVRSDRPAYVFLSLPDNNS